MKKIIIILSLFTTSFIYAQDVYKLKSSEVNFFAGTALEDIQAKNKKSSSFLNIKTGELVISIPNTQFVFPNALMQDHFNENYMESEKFPKSEFKGKIINIQNIDFKNLNGIKVQVDGYLTIHGVTQHRVIEVVLKNEKSLIVGVTKFIIKLEDHEIKRPQILWEKISEQVEVNAQFNYEVYVKK
jgi:hypothetical protein